MQQLLTLVRNFGLRAGAVTALACLGLSWMALAPQVHAASPLERNTYLSGPRYDARIAPCEAALGFISAQFAEKESKFWNSALQITGYSDVREHAARQAPDSIPRRSCSARAMLNDGRLHTVRYSIIEDGGFASFSSGVEWCVVGVDRNLAYNPACHAARP
jgi:hypothetical protein